MRGGAEGNDAADADDEVVVTGADLLCALGTEPAAIWDALVSGRTGFRPIETFAAHELPCRLSAELTGWDAKEYVQPRKNLKVMSRDAQLAVAGAIRARNSAGLAAGQLDPDRIAVIYGADRVRLGFDDCAGPYVRSRENGAISLRIWGETGMFAIPPLAFLKTLPNMIPAHVSIALDARGPNNTLHHGAVSGLLALEEGVRAVSAGRCDTAFVGSAASRLNPYDWARAELHEQLSRSADPAFACRPFDVARDGSVRGEGAGTLVLERRRDAVLRKANVLGTIRAAVSTSRRPTDPDRVPQALRAVVAMLLRRAGMTAADLGHINAHGLGSLDEDRWEAGVFADLLPDVPVIAPKANIGNLYAGGGIAELVVSLLAFRHDLLPPIAGTTRLDPACPLRAVLGSPLSGRPKSCLVVNFTRQGQVAGAILTG